MLKDRIDDIKGNVKKLNVGWETKWNQLNINWYWFQALIKYKQWNIETIYCQKNQFLFKDFSNITYVGFVILSKSGWDYKYKDHIFLNENYNSYLHLKLDIGTYMIVPM